MAGRRKAILKRVEVQKAVHMRTCKYSREKIPGGELCIVVWDEQYKKGTYSKGTALKMIQDARKALLALEKELEK